MLFPILASSSLLVVACTGGDAVDPNKSFNGSIFIAENGDSIDVKVNVRQDPSDPTVVNGSLTMTDGSEKGRGTGTFVSKGYSKESFSVQGKTSITLGDTAIEVLSVGLSVEASGITGSTPALRNPDALVWNIAHTGGGDAGVEVFEGTIRSSQEGDIHVMMTVQANGVITGEMVFRGARVIMSALLDEESKSIVPASGAVAVLISAGLHLRL